MLSTPNAKKQLPEGLLNGCAMQLAAVLKDQKNRKEVEVHAEQLDAIAKDWPIVNIVKLQTASEMPSIGSRTKATAKAQQSQRSQRQSDFEQIKAMARPRVPVTPAPPQAAQVDVSRGEWREEADAWRFSVQVSELASLSGSQLQVDPSYIRLMDSNQRLLVQTSLPGTLDGEKMQAFWSRKQQCLKVVGPKKPSQGESMLLDELD